MAETALDGAKWLLDKVINLLADDLVAGYVSSCQLGINFKTIQTELMRTQGLLEEAQKRGVGINNRGLQGLLELLRKKGDEAEDVLDELHYYLIRDKVHGTHKYDPWVRDNLGGRLVHGRAALRHAVGNCFSCFSCSPTHGVDDVISNPYKAKSRYGHHVDQPSRVEMSDTVKLMIEEIQSLCKHITELLQLNATNNPVGSIAVTVGEPRITSSITGPTKMYGRDAIFNKTLGDMTSAIIHRQTLTVLPVFGIGGIGKTTFAQHLYNHETVKQHFTVRAWVCVSTNFDVLKLTKGILDCIPVEKSEDGNNASGSDNLDQLQQSIVKRLKSKRFLIVLDDIWKFSRSDWEDLLAPLNKSECENGSMVLVTTRDPSIAQEVKTNNSMHLKGLKPSDIMEWFHEYVFDQSPPGSYDHECMNEIAMQIAHKLKGSPLAATTVGRLLKKNLSQEHWKGILERQEWLDENNPDGILPALKISYNYLPFHLKKCFMYFGLFPQDYKFSSFKITQFWVAIGIIDSNNKYEPEEVTGLKYFKEFVNCGFLTKEGDESNPSYVMHDSIHDLSRHVSSHECANICSTNFRADEIPESIRHLSVTVGRFDGHFEEEMAKLSRRVNIGCLRSLMISKDIWEDIDNILGNTFGAVKRLRVLSVKGFISHWPENFSKLIHLRYLRIAYPDPQPISTIPILHHLKFLKIKSYQASPPDLPRNFSRCLVNLRHFITSYGIHRNIFKVGEMKYLQELDHFCVRKESEGFELDQLGKLKEIGGKLSISGLEKVETMKEASKADLRHKKNLHGLTLNWERSNMDVDIANNVIDGFEPHPNLRNLCIYNHPGAIGPSWLCYDISTTSLESLFLHNISWKVLPPFGLLLHLKKLRLEKIDGMYQFGPDIVGVTENSSPTLKEIVLGDMPNLIKWVGGAVSYNFFSKLERIKCFWCPELSGLPFTECTNPSTQGTNPVWFPNLCELQIFNCPNLSLPPLPHTPTLTDITVEDDKEFKLKYREYSLHVQRYNGALAFDNLDKAEKIWITDAPEISLTDLRKLRSLRDVSIFELKTDLMSCRELSDDPVLPSVQRLEVSTIHSIEKLFPRVFNCFPNILELGLHQMYFKDVAEDEEQVLPQFPSDSLLCKVTIDYCKNLVLPLEDGGGFVGLTSLESLSLQQCDKIFSRWSTGASSDRSTNPLLPASLRNLEISYVPSMRSMDLIEHLTSLTHLRLTMCDNLTVDGFNPHITLNLKELVLFNGPQNPSLAADIFAEVAIRSNPLAAMGFFGQLEYLEVDSIAAVLVDQVCKLLSTKLHTLHFCYDRQMESFTEEQDKALQQLVGIEELEFWYCSGLQCLPEGLHRLRSLKRLRVSCCEYIQSFPQNGLPRSLEKLDVDGGSLDLYCKAKELTNSHIERYPNLR